MLGCLIESMPSQNVIPTLPFLLHIEPCLGSSQLTMCSCLSSQFIALRSLQLGSRDRLAVTQNSSPEHMMLCCHYLNVRLSILLARSSGHFPSLEAKANPCIWQAATLWEAGDVHVGEDTLGGPRRNVREADWAEKEEMVPDVQGWPSRQVSWSRGVVHSKGYKYLKSIMCKVKVASIKEMTALRSYGSGGSGGQKWG